MMLMILVNVGNLAEFPLVTALPHVFHIIGLFEKDPSLLA